MDKIKAGDTFGKCFICEKGTITAYETNEEMIIECDECGGNSTKMSLYKNPDIKDFDI